MHVAQEVCADVPHRQVVLTLPKRLRIHARYDRKLLGKLCRCAWQVIKKEMQRLLGRDDVVPGMVAGIHTAGQLLHWKTHLHCLLSCGCFTPEGTFLPCEELDLPALLEAWREAVFALYLNEDKIAAEVVEQMRGWKHSGFGADQSVRLAAGDQAGIERLIRYITRCPFSLSRLVKVTAEGMVVYKAEKPRCQAFPEVGSETLKSGAKRNFQLLSPLDFLAELTQHIPPQGSHLVRYYGWYSNRSRGERAQTEAEEGAQGAGSQAEADLPEAEEQGSSTWAMLLRRVFEVDPLACPSCGAEMQVVSFIQPPQEEVIEAILRHCGLWEEPAARAPPKTTGSKPTDEAPLERVYVDLDTFLAEY